MPPKRMTANPTKPSRYRAGKPTGASSDSDSDAEASGNEVDQSQEVRKIVPPPRVPSAGKIISNLSQVNLTERRRQGQEAEDRRVAAAKAARQAAEEGFVTEDSEDEDGSEQEDSDEDSDVQESSEEEAPRRLMLKPKFIPKSQRNGKQETSRGEDDEIKTAQEEERKKKAMDEMVEEQMRKDVAARAAGKKHWDDLVDDEDDVDTEDDVDVEAEYAAWKLRELKRIKREREAIEAREKEREEVERRRNLTEEERKAEDEVFLAKQKEEKDAKGKMSYMQKYFHKGAFFRDDAEIEGLANRDIMGSRFADDVKNRELLPKALQMRDMTKLGKKGASKYKDLRSEDTGRWGDMRDYSKPRGGFDRYDVDDRFRSDRDRDRPGPGGANSVPLGERKPVPGAPAGPKDSRRGRDDDNYREHDRYRDPARDRHRPRDDYDLRGDRRRSRSRSPKRHNRDGYTSSRRKRDSPSGGDRYESDKRRRIDAR
ncbi:splicing factor, Prp19-binding domain-containing protein [Xylariomycetidae sp. FL2044]|nr:splicing factor, Prp19-binding domain-containing protein [Xylariomycetidae sp. FL2044]